MDDARTTDKEARLALVAGKNGAPDCEFIHNCVRVCPKIGCPRRSNTDSEGPLEGLTYQEMEYGAMFKI